MRNAHEDHFKQYLTNRKQPKSYGSFILPL
ncbi:hypothetical protein NTGHW29_280022 [Candidatus Nitrotoga sp. HW29]|nr:hypothetical protein NTGHW29_280022 [Candidatus Nitrotoga sp. HW29]